MKIKSYFAGTVEAAVAAARRELGSDAMLMNTRKAMPEARHLGEYEVVFASPNASDAGSPLLSVDAPAAVGETSAPRIAAAPDSLAVEIADLKKQLEQLTSN